MKRQDQITTQRLSLSPLQIEDHEFIRTLVNTEGWIKFIGQRNVHSKEDALAYTHKIISSPDVLYWVVRTQTTSIPLGIVTLIKRPYLDHPDIGFAFLPDHQGKGYAQEAARALLDRIAHDPEHQTILATTLPENTHSIQLLTRLGFHFLQEMQIGHEKLQVYRYHRAPAKE